MIKELGLKKIQPVLISEDEENAGSPSDDDAEAHSNNENESSKSDEEVTEEPQPKVNEKVAAQIQEMNKSSRTACLLCVHVQ